VVSVRPYCPDKYAFAELMSNHDKMKSLTHLSRLIALLVPMTCIISFTNRSMHHARLKTISMCANRRIFVGVFTDGGGVEKYATRRAAMRASWFPNTTEALQRVECKYGMTIRFVVGYSPLTNDTRAVKKWREELAAHDDFLKLDALDTYRAMTGKTAKMFRHVSSLGQKYEYVVKVDDDMFVSLSHLAKAVDQWADMKADYVGCMTNPGNIYRTEGEIAMR
jgi:hypothetical protein